MVRDDLGTADEQGWTDEAIADELVLRWRAHGLPDGTTYSRVITAYAEDRYAAEGVDAVLDQYSDAAGRIDWTGIRDDLSDWVSAERDRAAAVYGDGTAEDADVTAQDPAALREQLDGIEQRWTCSGCSDRSGPREPGDGMEQTLSYAVTQDRDGLRVTRSLDIGCCWADHGGPVAHDDGATVVQDYVGDQAMAHAEGLAESEDLAAVTTLLTSAVTEETVTAKTMKELAGTALDMDADGLTADAADILTTAVTVDTAPQKVGALADVVVREAPRAVELAMENVKSRKDHDERYGEGLTQLRRARIQYTLDADGTPPAVRTFTALLGDDR